MSEVDSTIPKEGSNRFIPEWDDDRDLSELLVSAYVTIRKPALEG